MPVPVYTDEQLQTLRRMFAEYATYDVIGAAIGRTKESINQKVIKLGLKRNKHVSLLVRYHGPDVLKYGDTSDAIYEGLAKARKQQKIAAGLERKAKQELAIETMKANLANGMKRNTAIKTAFKQGALQIQIAEVVGLTKQGVSYVIFPKVRRPRNHGY